MNLVRIGKHTFNVDKIVWIFADESSVQITTLATVPVEGGFDAFTVTLLGEDAQTFLAWLDANATNLTPKAPDLSAHTESGG